jgi:hypothetical protein
MIETTSTSIATRSEIRNLATTTTILIATTGLAKTRPLNPTSPMSGCANRRHA